MKNGWEKKTLADVCEISSALVDPRRNEYQSLVHVGGANIEANTGELFNLKTAKDEGLISGKFVFDEKMVLYSKIRPYLMKVARPDFKGLCSADIYPLVPRDGRLDRGFLYYVLLTERFTEFAVAGSARSGMPKVNREHLFAYSLSVPPLPEQRRIVGILDESFDGIATAKTNAEKNLQNARALFESHLQAVFTQRDEGWVEKHLKEVCEKITDGTHQTPKYFDDGIIFLSSRNVTSGRVDWDRIKYIDTKQHLEMHKRVAPRRGDVLLAKNGTTGVAAIVDRDTTFDIYVSLALLRALPVIRPQFLLYFINSPAAKHQFNKRLKGIGVPNLHLEEIREVRISYPSNVDKQDHIVAGFDCLAAETQRLESFYRRKLAALDELKKSLLHRAFSGQL
jgi:type I restriction enzyme S subunit